MAAQYESWTLPFSCSARRAHRSVRSVRRALLPRAGKQRLCADRPGHADWISAKNAILIVEFAKAEYDKGATLMEAALTGARLRLRPILMTAFAFILGCVPLWTATGAGAISRQVLGTCVIGGMFAATFLAIFFIPVLRRG